MACPCLSSIRAGRQGGREEEGGRCNTNDIPARPAFREQVLNEVQELRVGRHDGSCVAYVCGVEGEM